MNVAELAKLPPDTRVTIRGYEGGIDDILSVVQVRARIGTHRPYEGDHSFAVDWDDEEDTRPIEVVAHLSRYEGVDFPWTTV